MGEPPVNAHVEIRERLRYRALWLTFVGSLLAGGGLALSRASPASDFGLVLFGVALVSWFVWHRWLRVGLWTTTLLYLGVSFLAVSRFGGAVLPGVLVVSTGLTTILLGLIPGLTLSLAISAPLIAGDPLTSSSTAAPTAALFALWATQGFLYAATVATYQSVDWLSVTYEQMRRMLEAARDQRLELKQTQEDLVRANQELARVSERLRSMREIAEQARRAKEEFIANVSHELRTPLNMIIGFSEMITQAPHVYGPDLPPRLLADIDVIQANSQHLASLVNDVLDLSQADSSRMALSREWVSPGQIIDAAVAAVTPLFESKGLALRRDVPDDLRQIYCDRTRIRQVVLNLLSNAGRFTERGHVRVEAHHEGEHIVISVSDTGPGIASEAQERIFQPFEQLDGSIRQRYGGSGLGLTISRRFVELHGGEMWLTSELGVGTTFFVRLSIAGRGAPSTETPSLRRWFRPDDYYESRNRPWQAPAPRLVPRLVVVESGSSLRRLFAGEGRQLEIVAAPSLEDGIEEVSRTPSQALVINDPRALGDAGRESLRALPNGTPVLTCWWPDERAASERLGLVRYLVKPIKRETLLAALEELGRPIRTVLLTDDDSEAIQLFDRMLASSGKGYRVMRATTGRRALALMRQHLPDVVLLDLIMPEMDGYEVLQEKSLDPAIKDIPTIAISAQDPIHGPILSELVVSKGGGLSVHDIMRSVLTLSEVLAPPDRLDGGHHETPSD